MFRNTKELRIYTVGLYSDTLEEVERVFSYLPEETRYCVSYYLAKLEALKGFPNRELMAYFYTLRHINIYPVLDYDINDVISQFDILVDRACGDSINPYISESTALSFLSLFRTTHLDDLTTLSPMNFLSCQIFDYERIFRDYGYRFSPFFKKLRPILDRESKELEEVVSERVLDDLDIEVQNYFRMVGSIYNYLEHKNSNLSERALKRYSLLLAMFYFKDPNDDFNISKAFRESFPYLSGELILKKCLGIDEEEFLHGIEESFDVGDLIVHFKNELSTNDLFQTISTLFRKNGEFALKSICSKLDIDDDRLSYSFDKLCDLRDQSISDELVDDNYARYIGNLSIEDIKAYKLAAIIFKKIKGMDSDIFGYTSKTPEKIATVSLLLSMYIIRHKDIKYLEYEGIFLEDVIEALQLKGIVEELSNEKLSLSDIDKRTLVIYFAKFLEDHKYRINGEDDNSLINNLFTNGNRTFLKLLLISLGKNFDVIFNNIKSQHLPDRVLTPKELERLLKDIKPDLDIHSLSSISTYGIDLMNQVNAVIDSMLSSIRREETEGSLALVRDGIDSIYEVREDGSGILSRALSRLRRKDKEVIVHIENIDGLNRRIDEMIATLKKQTEAYEIIRQRNHLYYMKLEQFITVAEEQREELLEEGKEVDKTNIVEVDDYETRRKLLDERIRMLKTSRSTMETHFVSVGLAISSNGTVINTLSHIRNDFVPLLSTGMLIQCGVTSSKQANLIARNVIDLTRHYLSNDLDHARSILGDLQTLGVPEEKIQILSSDLDKRSEEISRAMLPGPSLEDIEHTDNPSPSTLRQKIRKIGSLRPKKQ